MSTRTIATQRIAMRKYRGALGAMTSGLLSLFIPASTGMAANQSASEFSGTWKVADTSGKPFEITLSATGWAKADRTGEGMSGTWIDDGESAVITWDTGWTTKITRIGESFTKTAYDKAAATPTNTSPAEKVE